MKNRFKMRKPKRGIRIPLFIFATLLLTFSLSVFIASSVTFDGIKSLVEKRIGESIDRELSIDKIRLSLIKGPVLEVSGIYIENNREIFSPFYVEKMKLELAWRPLLKKQIVFKNIILENPQASIVRTENGRFYIRGLPEKNSLFLKKGLFTIEAKNISIKKGSAIFIDKKISDPATITDFHDIDLEFANNPSDNYPFEITAMIGNALLNNEADLSAKGTLSNLTANLDISKIQFNTDIKLYSVNYESYSSYLKDLSFLKDFSQKGFSDEIKAEINLKRESDGIAKLSGKFTPDNPPFGIPYVSDEGYESPEDFLSCNITFDKNSVKIKKIGVAFHDVEEDQKVKISTVTRNGKPYTKITAKDVSVKDLKKYIPAEFLPERLLKISDKFTIGGTLFVNSCPDPEDKGKNSAKKSFTVELKDIEINPGNGLAPVKAVSGIVSLNNTGIKFENASAKFRNSQFSRSSLKLTEMNTEPKLQLSLRGDIDGQDVIYLKKKRIIAGIPSLDDISQMSGKAGLNLFLNGYVKDVVSHSSQVKGVLDLKNVTIVHNQFPSELKNIHGKIDFTRNTMKFSSLNMLLDNSKVVLSEGLIDLKQKEPFVHFKIDSDNISVQNLLFALPVKSDFLKNIDGMTNTKITIAGYPHDMKKLSVKGEMKLSNTVIRPKNLSQPIYIHEGNLSFNNDKADIKNATVKIGSNLMHVNGRLQNFMEPKFDLNIVSPYMELNELSNLVAESGNSNTGFFDKVNLKSQLKIDKAKYNELYFQDISSKVSLNQGQLTVEEIEVKSDDAHVIHIGENVLTQSIHIKGYLTTQNLGNFSDWKNNTQGHIIVEMQGGHIKNAGLMGNLTSQLSNKKAKDAPHFNYDSMQGDLFLNNGVIIANEWSIHGKKINIASAGKIDFPKETLDLKVKVLTSNAVERIMNKLSLVTNAHAANHMNDKNLIAHLYEIKGPISNPEVKKIPYNSLELMALKTFHNILKLPINAIQLPEKILSSGQQ